MPFRPRGSRFYHYDFQIRGRRFHGSCRTDDFEEAKAIEADARVAAARDQKTKGQFTVSEAIGTYWSDVCRPQPSAGTAMSQGRAIMATLDPKTHLSELRAADLVRMVAKMRATAANGTVNRRIDMLARSIRHMVRVHDADAAEIDWPALKTREAEERVRELTQAEQGRLFAKLRPDLLPMVKFALMTGQRKAEICRLRWSDVNHETQRIHIRVKGGKTHRFPMNAEIRALLSAVPRSNVLRERPYVFTWLSEDGERYRIDPSGGHIWTFWREAVAAAEIEDFRFHDLRHTFATRLLRQTGNLKLVSRLLGHASIETTMRYAHVIDEDLAAAMDAFSACGKRPSPEITPEEERKSQ